MVINPRWLIVTFLLNTDSQFYLAFRVRSLPLKQRIRDDRQATSYLGYISIVKLNLCSEMRHRQS
jgi:hypothetical protein